MMNSSPEVLWGIGIIILAVVLVYGMLRAGRLRRSERERVDQRTAELQRAEQQAERSAASPDFGLRPNVPYAILIPILVAAFAVGWMIWSMHGTSMGTQQSSNQQGRTTGQAMPRQSNQPVAVPTAPTNGAESDSWRGQHTPVSK